MFLGGGKKSYNVQIGPDSWAIFTDIREKGTTIISEVYITNLYGF
jgi:hypothetical protein